jgi:hypothetical protein
MRGPSGPQARTVRTADRPASGPNRPAAQYGAQQHVFVIDGEREVLPLMEDEGDSETRCDELISQVYYYLR